MAFGKVSPATFEWTIPSFQEILQSERSAIGSPDFHLLNSSWYLSLHFDSEEWIKIILRRGERGAPKSITYTIKINGKTSVKEITGTSHFNRKGDSSKGLFILKKEVASDSNLLITCYIRPDPIRKYLAGGREFLSSAVQVQVANTVIKKEIPKENDCSSSLDSGREFLSSAVQVEVANTVIKKEIPKEYDCSSSLDSGREFLSSAVQVEVANSVTKKEIPKENDCSSSLDSESEFLTGAVQTNVPDCVSCALQTENANNVIEKENPKDLEWPLLDMKGIDLLTESMKDLLIKSKDHDLTICVKNKTFRAHRNILSARSPVFAMMLAHDTKENNTGTISIEDCDPESFDEFLLYVYSGKTENLTPCNALQLCYTADKYDFPVLKEKCMSLLKT